MKIAVVFFSKSGKTALLADTLFSSLSDEHDKQLIQINALEQNGKEMFNWSNKKKIKLIATQTDLTPFELVFFGSTVEGMSPKRKIPQEMEVYLKECKGLEGKPTAIFLSCFGIPGTTLQKIQSILQTRNAKIVESHVFTYLLHFSAQQLQEIKTFAGSVIQKSESVS